MTALRSVTGSGLFADGRRLLRTALRIDAVITGVNGLACLALAGPLESLLGLEAGAGRAIGVFLLVYAVAVGAVAAPDRIRRGLAMAVVEANLLWTVLSIAVVATGRLDLNAAGGTWAVLQALVVAGFAALQYTGIRRTR